MATIRISQLTAISAPTDDDILIINDADTNTRKITFANLTQGLLNTSATAQTKSGNLTVSGTLTAANLTVDTDTLFVNGTTNRVGIGTATPNTDLDVDGNIHIRNQGVLELGDSNDSNFIGLRAPNAITSNFTLTLPSALPVGSSNIMVTDTSGNVTFPADTSYSGGYLNSGGFGVRNAGEVRFYELNTNGGEYISLKAPGNLAGPTDYTLPGTYPGSNGFVLSSDTTGNLSWVSNASAAAGSSGYVQFNTGGSLDADSTFSFNAATNTLSVQQLDCGSGGVSTSGDVEVDGAIDHNGIAEYTVHSDTTVATATSLDVGLGAQGSFTGYKLVIVARDSVTGDVETYEHLIVQDGSGGISEMTGANVQAPTPGTFLTTPSTAVSGGNIVCSITNTAASGNSLSVAATATAIAAL